MKLVMTPNLLHFRMLSGPESKEWIEVIQRKFPLCGKTKLGSVVAYVLKERQFLLCGLLRGRLTLKKRFADIRQDWSEKALCKREDIDFVENFAPLAKFQSIR